MTAHLTTESAPQATAECRREVCHRPVIGRGLCSMHYGRWQIGKDPLEMTGDVAPPPARLMWVPHQVAN